MYKKEDLKLFNMKRNSILGRKDIFSIEDELTIDEKIKFIDEVKDNIASYLLNIFTKWENEKDSLPKNKWNLPKVQSFKPWIKRNDDRKMIDTDYEIGSYYLFGTKYTEMSSICPNTENGYAMIYTGDNIVNQWFHDLCIELYNKEEAYFKMTNPIQIKISQVKEYAKKFNIYFDSKKINDIVWNNDVNITEQELDIYLNAYEKIRKYINSITEDVENQIKSSSLTPR